MPTKIKDLPPLAFLHECFEISAESPSGIIWKKRPVHHFEKEWVAKKLNTQFAGKQAGNYYKSDRGYERWDVKLRNEIFLVHRVVYYLHNGRISSELEIDHIDTNSLNNNPLNLREATTHQNRHNTVARKNSSTGLKGIKPNSGQFEANIYFGGRHIYLGLHRTPELAHAAYCKASTELHGEFGRTS